jgi:hypothetical protein
MMGDAARDREQSPDVLVQINAAHAPERHVAFLDALAELLAARVFDDLNQEQTHDDNDASTT